MSEIINRTVKTHQIIIPSDKLIRITIDSGEHDEPDYIIIEWED